MVREIFTSLWYLLAAGIVLLLPGAAWNTWFPLDGRDLLERLADAVGISISFYAIGALIYFLCGVSVTGGGLALVFVGLGAAVITGSYHRVRNAPFSFKTLAGYGLAGVFILGMVAWRLYQARSLALPAWVDSVHHVLIVRQILEKGGLPDTLLPDLPVPFYYHYGFHVVAAVYTALSRLSVDQAVLVFGQVLSAAAGLSIYRLSKSIWRSTPGALAAALLVTFLGHMPAYYLTWGRYTLLTGLVVLPLAMSQALEITRQDADLDRDALSRKGAWLAVLTAGVLLCHYLGAILLAIFLVILGIELLCRDVRAKRFNRKIWSSLVLPVGIGTLGALPWLWRVWEYSRRSFTVSLNLSADAPDATYFPNYLPYIWSLLGPYHNYVFLGIGAAGLIWVLVRRRGEEKSLPLALWAVILGLLTIPWGVKLGPFRPDHLAIVLFIPAGLLAGRLLVSACEALERVTRAKIPTLGSAIFVVTLLCGWGARQTASILNPSTVFADAADVRALDWIKTNTPDDAVFWINTTHWQGDIYRGLDGGWWILTLTGRKTILPPVAYAWGDESYNAAIKDLVTRSAGITECGGDLRGILAESGADYVYLREGKGNLQPEAMKGCAGFAAVYQDGGVWIFEMDEG